LLEKKWISSTYFDQGLKYESSRMKVVSLSELLKVYSPDENVDAILLNCADGYQGIISINDVKNYDLQLASQNPHFLNVFLRQILLNYVLLDWLIIIPRYIL